MIAACTGRIFGRICRPRAVFRNGDSINRRIVLMDMDLKKLTKDLAKLVGKENAFTDKPTALTYAKDTMPWDVEARNMPYAVVRPAGSHSA